MPLKQWNTEHGNTITRLVAGRSNVFLISNGPKALLVDTSWQHAWPALRAALDRLETGCLSALILTHTHFDHAENAARVKERYGVQVFVQQNEAAYLAQGNTPFPPGTTVFTRGPMAWLGPRLAPLVRYPPAQPDVCVGEAYDLRPLGFEAVLLHTPGHSAGSMSVIVNGEIAITGDAMFGVFPGDVFPPFAEDVPELVRSWKKLLDTGCRLFLPSHGQARTREQLLRGYEKRRG